MSTAVVLVQDEVQTPALQPNQLLVLLVVVSYKLWFCCNTTVIGGGTCPPSRAAEAIFTITIMAAIVHFWYLE